MIYQRTKVAISTLVHRFESYISFQMAIAAVKIIAFQLHMLLLRLRGLLLKNTTSRHTRLLW